MIRLKNICRNFAICGWPENRRRRNRYERLLKSKGDNVIVGVDNGVCGGCHMKLSAQILVTCQGHKELVSCINCGRILYYTRDMALSPAE